MTPDALLQAFRPAVATDLAAVIEFRRAQFGSESARSDETYLPWRYRFGQPGAGRGELWLLERCGEVLAILGTEDVTLAGGAGNPGQVLFLMDILVREDMRGVAIGPWMNMVLQARYGCLAVFGSNRNSNGIVTGMFPEQRQIHTYTFYLSCSRIVRRRFDMPFLSGFVAGVIDVALAAWRLLHARTDRSIGVAQIADAARLQPELSQWTYVEGELGRDRSQAFIEWRALRNPRARYELFRADRADRAVGYLITRRRDDAGGRQLHIVDWHYDARDRHVLRAMLVAMVGKAAAEGYDAVSVSLSSQRTEQLLRQLGFIRRPLDAKPFVYAARPLHPLASGPADWRITTLDGDVD